MTDVGNLIGFLPRQPRVSSSVFVFSYDSCKSPHSSVFTELMLFRLSENPTMPHTYLGTFLQHFLQHLSKKGSIL